MNTSPQFNLLDDRMIRVHSANEAPAAHTLPAIFALLSIDTSIEFSGLQAHQSHAWHAFLCQLAAIAIHAAGESSIGRRSAAEWKALLLQTTESQTEPWCLVVPDLSKPAFFQPPVPERSLSTWKNQATEPDLVDLLVTSRNHDIKRRRLSRPSADHWVFALTSLQTMDGFPGRNNYGVVRMNGGYGSRAAIAVCADDDAAGRFVRDTSLLLERRDAMTEAFGFNRTQGTALLWTLPWDGTKSISLFECDPLVVEVCRRIRLTASEGQIIAHFIGTTVPRIDPGETKGNVGDVWIPVRRKDGAALTAKNLSYRLIQDVVFGSDFEPSVASLVREEDGTSPVIVGRVLARGQGKTEGYFERVIPCPPKAKTLLASLDGRQTLGSLARERIEVVTTTKSKVLKPALLHLLQGGPETLKFDDARADPFLEAFERHIDASFFASLFESLDLDASVARRAWVSELLRSAREILDDAIRGTPIPAVRRYRAIAQAERTFGGSARKNFPDNFQTATGGTDDGHPGTRS